MLQVLYSGETKELELSGTRQGLLAFGRLLREKAASLDLSHNPCPSPYDRSLSKIAFREDPQRAAVSIVTQAQVLRIEGGREALDLLADSIEGFAADAGANDHCHIDSPTYDYVAPESDPLVITFTK
ncbi:Imm32 family immunity protein [Streptomyces sp. NPDC002491]